MTIKRLVSLMFYVSAFVGLACMEVIKYSVSIQFWGLSKIFDNLFYFILGFFISASIVFYRLKLKVHINKKATAEQD
jgi:hypothetical protein